MWERVEFTAEIVSAATLTATSFLKRGYVAEIEDAATLTGTGYFRKRELPTEIVAGATITPILLAKRDTQAEILSETHFYPQALVTLRAEILSTTEITALMADKILESDVSSTCTVTAELLRKRYFEAEVAAPTTVVADWEITRYLEALVVGGAEIIAPFKIKRSGESFWTHDCHSEIEAASDFYISPGWYVGAEGYIFIEAPVTLIASITPRRAIAAEIASAASLVAGMHLTRDLAAECEAGAALTAVAVRRAGIIAEIEDTSEISRAWLKGLFKLESEINAGGAIAAAAFTKKGFTAEIIAESSMVAVNTTKKPCAGEIAAPGAFSAAMKGYFKLESEVESTAVIEAEITVTTKTPAPDSRTVLIGDNQRIVYLGEDPRALQVA